MCNPCPRSVCYLCSRSEPAGEATITWTSKLGKTYAVQGSGDLRDWLDIATGIAGELDCTKYIDQPRPRGLLRYFYRVREE